LLALLLLAPLPGAALISGLERITYRQPDHYIEGYKPD
jgi:hypothetical protein